MNNTIETAKRFIQENYKNRMYENYSLSDIENNTKSYYFRFFTVHIFTGIFVVQVFISFRETVIVRYGL